MQKIDYSGIYVDAAHERHCAEAKEIVAMAHECELKLYKIYADYRPNNENIYPYYIFAKTKRVAKQRFMAIVSWLDVKSIDECDAGETDKIVDKYEENLEHIFI